MPQGRAGPSRYRIANECDRRMCRTIPKHLPKPVLYCQPCQTCKNASTRQGGKACQPLEKRVKLQNPPAFKPGNSPPESRVKMRCHSHQSGKLPIWRPALHRVSASKFAAYQRCIFPQPRLPSSRVFRPPGVRAQPLIAVVLLAFARVFCSLPCGAYPQGRFLGLERQRKPKNLAGTIIHQTEMPFDVPCLLSAGLKARLEAVADREDRALGLSCVR